MNLKPCLPLVSLLIFAGCAHKPTTPPDFTPGTPVKTVYVAYDCGTPPDGPLISFLPIEWEWLVLEGNARPTLSVQSYSNLQQNLADVLLGVRVLSGQRDFWADCVSRSKTVVENLNSP